MFMGVFSFSPSLFKLLISELSMVLIRFKSDVFYVHAQVFPAWFFVTLCNKVVKQCCALYERQSFFSEKIWPIQFCTGPSKINILPTPLRKLHATSGL